jgi:hypothetical protein
MPKLAKLLGKDCHIHEAALWPFTLPVSKFIISMQWASLYITVFWNVEMCSLVDNDQYFRATCYFQFHGAGARTLGKNYSAKSGCWK